MINISSSCMFKDNLYVYCNSNPQKYIDPSGYWVVSAGLELGAAFVLGLYVMVGVNYDGTNLSVTLGLGVLCITNASAYINGYFAYYPNKKNVNSLNGIGLSAGMSFSVGVHLSGSGSAELSQGGNGLSVGVGCGASIAAIPYWQVKGGWTWTIVKWKLSSIKNGTSVTKTHMRMKIKVTKYANYTNIYIYTMKKTIRVYTNKHIKVY